MTKLTNALLASFLAIAVCGCSSADTAVTEQKEEPVTETQEEPEKEETVTQE